MFGVIDTLEARARHREQSREQSRERRKRAYDLRMQGLSFREIARSLGLKSSEGARSLVMRYEKQDMATGLSSLSCRARNALANAGITSMRALRVALKHRLPKLPNCGIVTETEIVEFARKAGLYLEMSPEDGASAPSRNCG